MLLCISFIIFLIFKYFFLILKFFFFLSGFSIICIAIDIKNISNLNRYNHGCAVFNNEIYVAGGYNG